MKLGPVLFQLPPHRTVNVQRLRLFLEALPSYRRYAFEFRDETGNIPEVFELLRSHNIAYCAFHLAGYRSLVEITADIASVRLQGPGDKYQGSYPEQTLAWWAARIEQWRGQLKTVYVYFDNDDSGYAAHNALRLREMLGESIDTRVSRAALE